MLGLVTEEEEARLFEALRLRRHDASARIDPALMPAAARHGIDGLLGADDPAWRPRVDAVRFRSLVLAGLTRRVSAALRSSSIPHAILKGVVAAAAWERPELRPQTDVDVLVAPGDVVGAIEALVRDRVVERSAPIDWQHATTLPAPDAGAFVDLHHSTGTTSRLGDSTQRLLARAAELDTLAGRIPSLASEDALLFLASHAGRHLIERIAWLVDIGGLAARSTPLASTIATRAEDLGVVVVTAFALDATARGLDDTRVKELLAALEVAPWRLAGIRWLRAKALAERDPTRRRIATLAARMALIDRPSELPAWLARKLARRRGEQGRVGAPPR